MNRWRVLQGKDPDHTPLECGTDSQEKKKSPKLADGPPQRARGKERIRRESGRKEEEIDTQPGCLCVWGQKIQKIRKMQ